MTHVYQKRTQQQQQQQIKSKDPVKRNDDWTEKKKNQSVVQGKKLSTQREALPQTSMSQMDEGPVAK